MTQQQQASRGLWLFLSGGILVYIGWTVIPMIYCHYNGKEAIAVVTDTQTKTEGGVGTETPHQVRYYTLRFDGHVIQKRTSGKRKIGEQLPVIYLVSRPEVVVRGSRADGLWHTIEKSTNERNLAIAISIAVFFLYAAAKTKPNFRARSTSA